MKLRDLNPLMEQFLVEYASEDCADDRRIELERLMEAVEIERAERLDSLDDWRRGLLGEAEFLGEEIERLTARKRSLEAHADRIKRFEAYLLNNQKLKTPFHTYYFTTAQSVVADVGLLPEELIRRYDPVPKKDEIAKRLKAGEIISGAHLEAGQPTLVVR